MKSTLPAPTHHDMPMLPIGTILARCSNPDGTSYEIESSQWECPVCQLREARPERFRVLPGEGGSVQVKTPFHLRENGTHRKLARRF